jgi:hypothetical protein
MRGDARTTSSYLGKGRGQFLKEPRKEEGKEDQASITALSHPCGNLGNEIRCVASSYSNNSPNLAQWMKVLNTFS